VPDPDTFWGFREELRRTGVLGQHETIRFSVVKTLLPRAFEIRL